MKFSLNRGKGSHTWWKHPLLPDYPLCIPGKEGDDAGSYLEKQSAKALSVLAQRLTEQTEEEI
jgi:predicted RNA binding protein YcfA (HicA-like mRNA interferase family)